MELLSSNYKLAKGDKYLVAGLALAPAKQSGHNVCAFSGACKEVCVLWFSGRTVTKPVRDAMIRRAKLFFKNRKKFLRLLHKDLAFLERKALRLGIEVLVRLNTASDIPWEKIDPSIFMLYPSITFYDYTKYESRAANYVESSNINPWHNNYHLTYSVNEKTTPGFAGRLLVQGGNVAVVTDTVYRPQHDRVDAIPTSWDIDGHTVSTVDGDVNDYRLPWTDGAGRVIILRGKGGAERVMDGVESGFIKVTIGGVASLKGAA